MTSTDHILQTSKTIAVVGLSNKPERAGLGVATYLQKHGYRIVPVNPAYAGQEILGEKVVATLQEAAAAVSPARIDIVDCFRNPDDMLPIARDAVAIRAGCLWMQLGVINQQAADLASAAGIAVVMDRCIKIEHSVLASAGKHA